MFRAVALSGYRIAAGTLTISALTDTYAIEMLPIQSDQQVGNDWLRPSSEADVIEIAPEVVSSLAQDTKGYGLPIVRWKLYALTPGMAAYWVTTFAGGGFGAAVTIRTFDRHANVWRVYNCKTRLPRRSEAGEWFAGGTNEFVTDFVRCVAASA